MTREASVAALPLSGESQNVESAKTLAAAAAVMLAAIDVLDFYTALGEPGSEIGTDSHLFRLVLDVPKA